MDNTLCFCLNKSNLVLDKVLVSFNEIPIFFICIDQEKNRYVVLCSDIDDFQYIIVPQKTQQIVDMLSQKITMRDLFENIDHFWSVQSGNVPDEDIVELHSGDQMDKEILPESGALYTIVDDGIRVYLNKLCAEVSSQGKNIDLPVSFWYEQSIEVFGAKGISSESDMRYVESTTVTNNRSVNFKIPDSYYCLNNLQNNFSAA